MNENTPLKKSLLYPTFLLGFFLYIHSYLPIYIHSSFLDSLLSAKSVGLIFTAGSILSIAALILVISILNRFGNFKTTLAFLIAEFLLFIGLFYLKDPISLILLFILGQATIRILIFTVDVFLESNSGDEETGNIRGLFLTLNNMALVTMPFVATLLISARDYQSVYFLSAMALIPTILILLYKFRKFEDPVYTKFSVWQSLSKIAANVNLRRVYISHLILKVFYAVMVVYTPIYLHEVLGFSWEQIGILFTIMLLPFVLFELPIGKIADKKYGEKEILTIGFVIMGLSTMALYFFRDLSFFAIAAILFLTRTGASAVEITSETYFFKKVDRSDSDLISFYRILDPLSYLIGPIIATLSLYILSDYGSIFLILGLIVLFGLRYSLTLQDTK